MATDNVTLMDEARDSMSASYEDLTGFYREALATWMTSGRAVVDAAQAMGAETIGFWHARTKAGLETASRLAECTSPQTLLEIQMDHARTTVHAYADQMAKLRAVGGALVRDQVPPARARQELMPPPAPVAAEIAA